MLEVVSCVNGIVYLGHEIMNMCMCIVTNDRRDTLVESVLRDGKFNNFMDEF